MTNSFDPDKARRFAGPYLGPNCLQMLKQTILVDKRGSCICAHAWIFFELCIIMTRYMQTMKMYVLN